jgi:DNA-directed RNA polymerase specialized sigma54-like protein
VPYAANIFSAKTEFILCGFLFEKLGENGLSADGARKLIREMISAEDPYRPLSDRQIAEAITARGCTVARRTVAKYREELGIPVRRREKRSDLKNKRCIKKVSAGKNSQQKLFFAEDFQ